MKSVMKKLFSLLLVGVVTVSMFGFVAPPVEAAEANKLVTDKTIIRSFVKPAGEIEVTTETVAGKIRALKVTPPKGSRFSKTCSFKTTHPEVWIGICFSYYDPSNPTITRSFTAIFEKLEYGLDGGPLYKDTVRDPDKSIFIEIDKNAKVTASTFNGWQLTAFFDGLFTKDYNEFWVG